MRGLAIELLRAVATESPVRDQFAVRLAESVIDATVVEDDNREETG